jgi:hypothetical protein
MRVFADHAQKMRAKGLAVLPVGPGRRPYVNSFNAMRYRPGEKIVGRWCEAFPDANIAVMPGLSGRGAMVADCDTFDAADKFQDRFGASDLKVRTRRGVHCWYARAPFRLPGNLKKFGLEVDLKTGNQIVIAPPSIHESGHIYRLDGCDWDALHKLRSLKVDKLHEFIHGLKQQAAEKHEESSSFHDPRELRDDSRGLCINDTVFGYALRGASQEECIAMAYRLNETFADTSKGRLSADEVFERAVKAWQDGQSGRFKMWGKGRRSVIRLTREESDRLTPDALKLLTKLRAEHSARCERGETFKLSPIAIDKAGFMPRKRIEKARAELLKAGLVAVVVKAVNTRFGRVPATYRLSSPDASHGGGAAAGQS